MGATAPFSRPARRHFAVDACFACVVSCAVHVMFVSGREFTFTSAVLHSLRSGLLRRFVAMVCLILGFVWICCGGHGVFFLIFG